MMIKTSIFSFLTLLSLWCMGQEPHVFSGVVIDQEHVLPVEGTYIFNLTASKEAVTDSLGFFKIEALEGDTLVFRDLRYEASTFVIPDGLEKSHYGIIQMLKPNTVLLDEVKVFSFPTQEEFNREFLSVQPRPNMESRGLELRHDLAKTVKENFEEDKYTYEVEQDRRIYELTGQIQPNHLLDPFRWTEFIRRLSENDK